jgi:hypothetical protein
MLKKTISSMLYTSKNTSIFTWELLGNFTYYWEFELVVYVSKLLLLMFLYSLDSTTILRHLSY